MAKLLLFTALLALVACSDPAPTAVVAPTATSQTKPTQTAAPTREPTETATLRPTETTATAPKPTATAATAPTPTPGPTETATPTRPAPTPAPTAKSPSSTGVHASVRAPQTATTLTITVVTVPPGIPEYDRGDWKHWVDPDGDCQDTRQEVLVAESLVPVTYETDRECRVETGRWWGPYLAHHLGNPAHIDIDHTVPLKNAHNSGGWRWESTMKEGYANHLADDDHLMAISSRHYRTKGGRGPEAWRPPDEGLWCQYAVDWTEIKERWGLTMTWPEAEAVMMMLDTCEVPPEVEVRVARVPKATPATPEPESQGSVYGTREEAAAAGETRVQGSSGGGRGFPAEMVPSARDGDGDGVICKQ